MISSDSPSLWNFTLSPGWRQEEIEILRLAIMKFGIGAWTKIVKTGCLPGKTPAQLNLQTQRIVGQQSLGEFMGVHLDARELWLHNQSKQGEEYKRKNGCLINIGNNPARDETRKKIAENMTRFGIPKEKVDSIDLPVAKEVKEPETIKQERKSKLKQTKQTLAYMENKLEELRRAKGPSTKLDNIDTTIDTPTEMSKDIKSTGKKSTNGKQKGNKSEELATSNEFPQWKEEEFEDPEDPENPKEGLEDIDVGEDSDYEEKKSKRKKTAKQNANKRKK